MGQVIFRWACSPGVASEDITALLKMLCPRHGALQIPDQYNDLFAIGIALGMQDAHQLVVRNDFDKAAGILEELADVDENYVTLNGWWDWISRCSQQRQPNKLERAGIFLNGLLPRIRQSGNRLAELEAQYLLMLVYEKGRHPEKAPAIWQEMNVLFSKLRNDKSIARDKLLNLILTHQIEHLKLCIQYGGLGESIDSRLQRLKFWTEMFPGSEKNAKFLEAHRRSRAPLAARNRETSKHRTPMLQKEPVH